MSIFVIGVNHKTAPVHVREKVYFAEDKLAVYLQDLLNRGLAQEAVLLSTCNRSELYCITDNITTVCEWFCDQTTLSPSELSAILYIYRNEEAVAHMMAVACGLDSMVLGEPQILGQMKDAYSESCAANAVDALFHRLFQQVFMVAKEIRTTTAIGACPVSVASAAVQFARNSLENFNHKNVLLIGAGDTSELLVRYLTPHLHTPITIVNRSAQKALHLAENYNVQVSSLPTLHDCLSQADVVFSATGSPTPILTQASVAPIMQKRLQKPLLFIDIAVPRDIDPQVALLESVDLHCIDDLKVIIENNRHGREHAADKAREMIRMRSQNFIRELQSFDKVAHTIRAYRDQIEELCQVELIKAKHQLQKGLSPDEVLDAFAHAFVNKLMHAPSVQLRQAGREGRFELLRFAKQLFAIPDAEVERL